MKYAVSAVIENAQNSLVAMATSIDGGARLIAQAEPAFAELKFRADQWEADFRERTGEAELQLELPDGSTFGDTINIAVAAAVLAATRVPVEQSAAHAAVLAPMLDVAAGIASIVSTADAALAEG